MLKFLARIFGTERSGQTAKERLKLVLLSDHLSLAPEVVEALKSDLLAVIERYVEIDSSHVVVDFEHRDHEIALTANVPIIAMRERPLPPSFAAPPLALVPPAPTSANGNGAASANGNAASANGKGVAGVAHTQEATGEPDAQAAVEPDAQAAVEPVAEAAQPISSAGEPASAEQPVAKQPVDELPAPPSDAIAGPPEELQAVASAEYPAELPGPSAAPRTQPAQKQRTRRRRRKGGSAPVSAPPLGNAAKA